MEKGEEMRDRRRERTRQPCERLPDNNDMITPRGTLRLLGVTTFLGMSCFIAVSSTWSAENPLRYEDQRIPIEHAKTFRARRTETATPRSSQRRPSLVAKAAQGRVIDQPPLPPLSAPPLSGPSVQGGVRQVGLLEQHGSGCGPVCDHNDPACGIEPVCGIGGIYVDEPACGFEVGCGIGAAIERMSPGCGVEGCTDCYESVCGVEGILAEGILARSPVYGLEQIGDGSCDSCGISHRGACEVGYVPLFLPMLRINWNRFQFFAGVQGYKGPLNFVAANGANNNIRSGSGSFGFQQGFNEGRSLRRWLGADLSSQFGLRATQSNLSGAEFTEDRRHQIFLTYGLFRRVDYGLQYGVVLDYLNDDWYFQGDLAQIRTELSWKTRGCHVFGFNSMSSLDSDTSTTVLDDGAGNVINSSIAFESTDQYRFFYRRLLRGNGEWNAFAGWTGNDDGVIGANTSLPLRRRLMLQTGATFLVPKEGRSNGGNREEGWNISLGLVYRPGGPNGSGRYSRPMFDVADNGSFMVDLK